MDIKKAIEELKKNSKKRNFLQTIDLIVNLKNFDPKREKVNFYIELPYPGKEKKVAIILEKENNELKDVCDIIVWKEMEGMDLKAFKKIERNYNYFITTPKIIPLLAKKFGKILGPRKKMPDPKLGCIVNDLSKNKIKNLVERLKKTIKVVNDGNSVKVAIGKENMEIKEIEENFNAIYSKLKENLPKGEANIKEVIIKLTMSKPIKVK